jgi:hypothetical protein
MQAPVKERIERLLEKSGRITPREVLEAYEETGLGVTFGCFVNQGRACAYGALMVRDGFTQNLDFSIAEWTRERDMLAGLGYGYGFYRGFDGALLPSTGRYPRKGYLDGIRARRFVLDRMKVSR